jgi:hypothetical protein
MYPLIHPISHQKKLSKEAKRAKEAETPYPSYRISVEIHGYTKSSLKLLPFPYYKAKFANHAAAELAKSLCAAGEITHKRDTWFLGDHEEDLANICTGVKETVIPAWVHQWPPKQYSSNVVVHKFESKEEVERFETWVRVKEE